MPIPRRSTHSATARSPRRRGWTFRAAPPAVAALLILASTALAHDFWIIPDMFTFAVDSTMHFSGRAGTRFPAGTPVPVTHVADARLIGATSQIAITQMSIEGTSLRLHQKPATSGQYLVVVTLTSNATRSTGTGLMKFLRAEGGAAEATRLERENALVDNDSVVYRATSYAEAIVEVGRGGPRAFAVSADIPLQFIPVNDPARLRVGDTLHVKIVGAGKPVPNIGIFAGPASDTTVAAAGESRAPSVTLSADRDGIVHLPLLKAGAWNLRAAHVTRAADGAPREWLIARTTYVFGVAPNQ